MRGGAKKKVVGESQKCERLRPAGPAPESSAPPRSSHVTAQLAVASRSAFRPSIGMPPPSKASVIEMCWSSRRLVPFDLRVRHLYGRLPSCIVSWFRFGPQQRCLVLGRCTSGAHGFHHGKLHLAFRKRPFFSRCAGELQRPLFITPTYTPEKSSYTCRQIHWNLVPDRKKSCSRSRFRQKNRGCHSPF